MDPYEHFNTYDLLWIINIQWLCTSSRTTNVLNNETNVNPIKRHCCLWLTFWILNNTHNAPLLSRGLRQVTFDLLGTWWIQIKCRFVLLRLNKLNPSAHSIGDNRPIHVSFAWCHQHGGFFGVNEAPKTIVVNGNHMEFCHYLSLFHKTRYLIHLNTCNKHIFTKLDPNGNLLRYIMHNF